ncbi:MAG: FMN-binding protein [Brevinema sp.]
MDEKNMNIGSVKFHLANVFSLTLITGFFTFLLLFVYYLTYVPINPLKDVEELLGADKEKYTIQQQNIRITDLNSLPLRKRAQILTYFKTSEIPQFLITDKDSNKEIMKVYLVSSGGFGGAVESLVMTDGQSIIAHEILDASTETAGLGRRVTERQFKNQFIGKNLEQLPNNRNEWILKNVDMISGATFSSSAVVNNLKKALNLFSINMSQNGGTNG